MDLLKQFEAYLKSTDRIPSAQFYCSDIRKFITWCEQRYGSFDPAAITPLDLVEYRGKLQSSGGRRTKASPKPVPAKPATVNRALVLINAGVGLDKVALLAGHTSVDITRRYTTPSEHELQEAVEHLAWE